MEEKEDKHLREKTASSCNLLIQVKLKCLTQTAFILYIKILLCHINSAVLPRSGD